MMLQASAQQLQGMALQLQGVAPPSAGMTADMPRLPNGEVDWNAVNAESSQAHQERMRNQRSNFDANQARYQADQARLDAQHREFIERLRQ